MESFMHILAGVGAAVLLVIGLIVIAAAIAIFKLRKVLKQLAGGGRSMTPSRIHLSEAQSVKWKNPSAFKASRDTALKLGFADLGAFTVAEMPGLIMNAFVKPNESSYCVIYQHPIVNMWFDFVTKYDDGTGLTVGNAPRGGELDVRPGQKKVNAKELNFSQLYDRLVQERDAKPLRALSGTKEEFVSIFEQAYADEMDWRNSRGGPTADEIRRVAEATGRTVDDRTVEIAQSILRKDIGTQ